MNILYYSWEENCKTDMLDALSRMDCEVSLITVPQSSYLPAPDLSDLIYKAAQGSHCDIIFSFNYLPMLSDISAQIKIPYVSWVYDCPHWTLFSQTISNPYNYIFLFDRDMVHQAKTNGATNIFHLPLAVNTHRLASLLKQPSCYDDDISFIGSLYENNMFRQIQYLPEHLYGYIDGILASQKQIWGQNLLSELMTPELINQFDTFIKYQNDPLCSIPKRLLYLSMLQAELTCRERIEYLNALSKFFPVSLYSASDSSLCPKAFFKGTVPYTTEMPLVFAHSKINLNISLRSITSGIPLRAMDIMGCGGFLLTNYQPELEEYFTNNEHYVYFESKEDLLNKADYYLSHPKERNEIAANALSHVTGNFSYEHQLNQMFSLL